MPENLQDQYDDIAYNNLKVENYYVIRFYTKTYNQKIAANGWGYAFLVKIENNYNNFDYYLGAVSYYSNGLSKLYKMFYITSNIECGFLNTFYNTETL